MVKRVADDMRMTCTAGCFCRFQEIPRFQGEDFAFDFLFNSSGAKQGPFPAQAGKGCTLHIVTVDPASGAKLCF